MFRITASFDDQIEVNVGMAKAREFFNEPRNFVELMPGVEAIDSLPNGNRRWTISADVPLIGAIRQSFVVRLTEDSAARIEWSPAEGEEGNLLRYVAEFEEAGEGRTKVRIKQSVEVRREKASDLHTFAGWVGESRISKEMQRGVTAMMEEFLRRAQQKLQ